MQIGVPRAICVMVVVAVCALPQTVGAQTAAMDVDNRIRALEEQVHLLQAALAALRGSAGSQPSRADGAAGGPSEGQAPSATPAGVAAPAAAVASAGAKVFNPDIGVIGNFLGGVGPSKGGSSTLAPVSTMTLQESEVSLQAIVDPYARADFFLAIGEQGIEVEEGYVTFPTLPLGLLVKAGKMRANFGRLNAFHNHTLPWIDRPLVMYNLLGGSSADPDTGIKDAGVSVSRLIPAGRVFVEATSEVFRGDSGTLFQATRRSHVSSVNHIRTYFDVSEATNVEAGTSYSRGYNDAGDGLVTTLYGADVTVRWRPLSRAIYHSVVARSEFMWSDRREPTVRQTASGLYGSLDYQVARRWFAGARYDRAERARDAHVRDSGGSGVLTFWPSEFSQVRGQYRRTRFGDDRRVANELLFQVLFTMGAHGAHPF